MILAGTPISNANAMSSDLLKKLESDSLDLSRLLSSATRERAKGVLAAELRKVEGELAQERERVANSKKEKGAGGVKDKKKAYDVQVKNFCKFNYFQ